MKPIFLICANWCIFLSAVSAQSGGIIESFFARQSGNEVRLDFTIAAGNTCNGVEILRSGDEQNFIPIGDIQGVCGSTDQSEHYSFTDPDPLKNAVNYYRLLPGSSSYSSIVKVLFIDFEQAAAVQIPTLFHEGSVIYLRNFDSKQSFTLEVYSLSGMRSEVKTDGINSFEIRKEELNPGVYIYSVLNEQNVSVARGKFVVY